MQNTRKIHLTAPTSWQYEGATNSDFGEVPISKLLKHELQTQLEMCHAYNKLSRHFLQSCWQPDFLFTTFSPENTNKIEARIDALTMALALKNKKRQRILISELRDTIAIVPEKSEEKENVPKGIFAPFTQSSPEACFATPEFECLGSPCGSCNKCINIC